MATNTIMITLPIFIILATITISTMAQRSPYVPRPVDYPGVLNRFGSTQKPQPLDNRFGSVNSNLPEETIYSQETIDRVASWPKEKQPFWYLNSQQIAQHHGRVPASSNNQGRTTASTSSSSNVIA
uniref:Venom protein family 15 protein 1 n=1 Tax=Pristhesancus plagipennis TaxID=1955184 RepID=A0A2K8JRM1_PRIPG|nr:venom protein family 15 protein 1 [Pristhesancus plagipennis]